MGAELVKRPNVRLTLNEVRQALNCSQGKVCGLKRKGRLGSYSYAAYNDYWSDDLLDYIDQEAKQVLRRLNGLRAAKVAILEKVAASADGQTHDL